jgi:hypothetical protein
MRYDVLRACWSYDTEVSHFLIGEAQKLLQSSECGVEADFVIDYSIPRTNLFDFQPKPPRGIHSSYQIAEKFVDDLIESVKVERLPRGAGISTQDNDDLAKT